MHQSGVFIFREKSIFLYIEQDILGLRRFFKDGR